MNDIDARMRDALHAAADTLQEQDLRPAEPPRSATITPPHRVARRFVAPLLAAAAVVVAAVVTSLVVSGSPNAVHRQQPGGTGSSTAPKPTGSQQPTPVPTPVKVSRATGSGDSACFFADACDSSRDTYYEPLWPFAGVDEAKQWVGASLRDGHSPWHTDARATARFFTSGYLGFTDLTVVTTAQVGADEAHIGIGYRDPNGGSHTAAVLHLVRYESTLGDADAPWEVVGSDDTTFSIEQPGYGTAVSSPMTVGGHITGVDEAISVTVRTLSGSVDKVAPVAAGGNDSPWSVTVPFGGKGVLTVVAVTGGHLIEHERFAIQGVHT